MQSKTSFFSAALFKKNLSRTWLVGLLYFLLLLILVPVSFIISNANYADDWYSEMGYTMEMRLFEHFAYKPTAGIAMVVAIIAAGLTFWYLFSKRDSYMMHAFPINRNSLYFTGILTTCIVTITPVLLVSLITSVVAISMGTASVSCIWYWALIVIVSTIFFIGLALFSLMTTGQIVTGIVFYFIFNYLYIMMEIAFRLTASILMFGMSQAMSNLSYSIWTPVLYIPDKAKVVSNIVTDDMGSKVISFTHEFVGGKYLAIYFVAAIVFMVLSYFMYKTKKLETVQDFIAVPVIKPIFSVGMSFFISMVAGASAVGMIEVAKPLSYSTKFALAIVIAIILGIIIYFATQMMIEKTFRVFTTKRLVKSLIYSTAALVVLLGMRFDLVKVENKVPDSKDIKWAAIDNQYIMLFRNKDDIEAVRELHKNFLYDKKELRDVNILYPDDKGGTFTIKYALKDGSYLVRSYSAVDTEANDVSASYVAATQPILDFINEPNRIKEHIIGNTWKTGEITTMTFSTYVYNDQYGEYQYNANDFEDLTSKEKKVKFGNVYKALLKDVDDGKVFVQSFSGDYYDYNSVDTGALYNDFDFTIHDNANEYFSDNEHYWGEDYTINPMYEQNITVVLSKDCKNTLKALKDEGFYTDDSEILTYAEYNQTMGYTDDYYGEPQ